MILDLGGFEVRGDRLGVEYVQNKFPVVDIKCLVDCEINRQKDSEATENEHALLLVSIIFIQCQELRMHLEIDIKKR